MKPSIGRIVIFVLSEDDAKQINRRRTSGEAILNRIKRNSDDVTHWPLGAQAHIGNEVKEGDEFPMIITRVWSDTCVNGQVFLDGSDCYWALSIVEGNLGHYWHWPVKV